MAGAGKKTFTVGEVLTASDVNGYLMDQAVMRFADSGARGSAIGTATEGMVSYLDDTDAVEVYDGSAWTAVGSQPGLIAVKHALFTGTQTASVAAGAGTAVTDLSITHTLADASNKLIISAYLGAAATDAQTATVGIAVADGGTLIGAGDAASNRTQVGAGGRISPTSNAEVVTTPSVTFVYEPGDTNSHTYSVFVFNIRTSSNTLYINRSEDDSDTAGRPRASSALVIQEVSV